MLEDTIRPVITVNSPAQPRPKDPCSTCQQLLLREVASFYRAVANRFGVDEADKAVDDWFELLGEVKGDQREIALIARRATIHSADRLASRMFRHQITPV